LSSVTLQALLICDQVIQDSQSSKKTLVGIFDKIFSKQFPALHPRFAVFTRFRCEPGKRVSTGYRITGPSGLNAEIGRPNDLDVGASGYVEIVSVFEGFPIPAPGEYSFTLLVNGKEIASALVTVLFHEEGTPAATES